MIDDLDQILSDIAHEEDKEEGTEWWCTACEHGPMEEKENKCTRCGEKNGKQYAEEEMTGWEDEGIEAEVEEIW